MPAQNHNDPNYILQINSFHRFNETYFLPPNAKLLWFMLIDLCNKCAWKDWIQVDTMRLMTMIGAQTQTAAFRARDALVQAGLLEYRKGGKGRPNQYRLHFFSCDHRTPNESENESKSDSKNDSKSDSINDSKSDSINDSKSDSINEEKTIVIDKQNKTKPNETRDSLLSAETDAKMRQRPEYQKIADLFNEICVSLPRVQTLSDKRRKAIRAASATVDGMGGWTRLFETVEQSDFLTGRNGAWNGCGFDWMLKSTNLVKILEGNYDDKAKEENARNEERFNAATTV
jgi:hypothetical protein